MSTRRAPECSAQPGPTARPGGTAEPGRPVGRAVVAGLVLAVGVGAAWIAGMIYTLAGWSG